MALATRPRFTLIPGSTYRVNFKGEEKELVFDGCAKQPGQRFIQWHDFAGKQFLNRLDDDAVFVVQSFA